MEKLKKQTLFVKAGFTLVELMTVVAIIGILAAISVFALAGSRESARDARRKADLQAVASALELFKADCNYYLRTSSFPSAGSALTGSSCTPSNSNRYIEAIPTDPRPGLNFVYRALPSGCTNCTRFQYWAYLEEAPDLPAGCSAPPSCGSQTCNYCVHNP